MEAISETSTYLSALVPTDVGAVDERSYAGLLPFLQRLDDRLAASVEVADRIFAARSTGDLYRGLAVSPADVVAALQRVPGEPFLPLSVQAYEVAKATDSPSLHRLLWLQNEYKLTEFDLDLLLIGLAPEIDLRYERLYAYLQDDVTRRRPSIDLALNVLCVSAAEKLQQRARFAPDAPLLYYRLIEVVADPHQPNSPLLARCFRLDEQIVRFLLLDDSVDSRLVDLCRMEDPREYQNDRLLTTEHVNLLKSISAKQKSSSIKLSFEGAADCGQAEAVALLAASLGMRVLEADLSRKAGVIQELDDLLRFVVREAWLRGAVLHIKSDDSQYDASVTKCLETLAGALRTMPVPFVFQSPRSWIPAAHTPMGLVSLRFSLPSVVQREYWWRQCLSRNDVAAGDELVSRLAQRYLLNFSQIQDAAESGAAAQFGAPDSTGKSVCCGDEFLECARAQTRHELAKLAVRIEPKCDWDDIVLPRDALTQLREICDQFSYRAEVLDAWGFGRKLSYGKGLNVLFAGPPGTGKTMAAEVVARELGLDLFKISLASVVSKYIGETEKNLEKIFTAASGANAVLFFDEADALFGKRSEVKDAHDRYANLEISYLLQKMEQYEGVTILATNLRQNLDEAFVRRLTFMVHFPFPDEMHRKRIWEGAWPAETPLAENIDLDALAQQFKLSGGDIKNIALAASFLGAAENGQITAQHVMHATSREYQKVGKAFDFDSLILRTAGRPDAEGNQPRPEVP